MEEKHIKDQSFLASMSPVFNKKPTIKKGDIIIYRKPQTLLKR